jgi:TRAP-type transport system periplasmic protein
MYKAELEKATNGRIKVEIYPAGQLGNAQRQSEGLRIGTIEGAVGPGELFVGADQRFQGLAMGGLFKDINHARRAMLVPQVRQAISEVAASRGMVFLGGFVFDLQSFVLKTPVAKLADFAGKRIRVLASESEVQSVIALGASAVPMSLGEVMPAIQQGTIDGASSGMPVFLAFKYHDAAPNLTDTHLWAIISIGLVSKPWYDRLPADLQKAVRDAAAKVEPELVKWSIAGLETGRKTWTAAGGKIFTLAAAEQAEAVKRVGAALAPILEKNAPVREFYNKVKAGADSVN